MPAAAVIPAPVAYTNIVAVKKLVVRCRVEAVGQLLNQKFKSFGTPIRFRYFKGDSTVLQNLSSNSRQWYVLAKAHSFESEVGAHPSECVRRGKSPAMQASSSLRDITAKVIVNKSV